MSFPLNMCGRELGKNDFQRKFGELLPQKDGNNVHGWPARDTHTLEVVLLHSALDR